MPITDMGRDHSRCNLREKKAQSDLESILQTFPRRKNTRTLKFRSDIKAGKGYLHREWSTFFFGL